MNPHFTEAWRAVATAKIDEFAYQCERLGTLARCAVVDRADAADVLTEIADAHSLGETFGRDYIITIIADAFVPPAVRAEAAA
ncbi:MAG TPA: hypothetical protein VF014_12205 [Casimicrobiaceae bacterium]|nr:hypothetical protein [Casimicrobiaceae bacterium]